MVTEEGAALGAALQAAWALARREDGKAPIGDFTDALVGVAAATRCVPNRSTRPATATSRRFTTSSASPCGRPSPRTAAWWSNDLVIQTVRPSRGATWPRLLRLARCPATPSCFRPRRYLMMIPKTRIALLSSLLALLGASLAAASDVPLNWLESAPPGKPVGVSFGVPWPRGMVKKDQTFSLTGADPGRPSRHQSWTLAYWPDGSIPKWTGHREPVPRALDGPSGWPPGRRAGPAGAGLQVHRGETGDSIQLDTGALPVPHPETRATPWSTGWK